VGVLKVKGFFEEAYQVPPESLVCLVCVEKSVVIGTNADSLCPICARLLEWFRGFYADDERLDLTKLNTLTRFRDLSADSLDYVEWIMETEEEFGVDPCDADAERLQTVGDLFRYIHHSLEKRQPGEEPAGRSALASDPMWDRDMDA
jgi:acyl carrier protein